MLEAMQVHPLTARRWDDFAALFGPRGACAGCWCMFWRLDRAKFDKGKGAGNRRAMKRLVDRGEVPGLLGYVRGRPVAWVSVAPREDYPALARSRILKPIDERPVWSVSCLFVARDQRNRGASTRMLEAAVKWVRRQGGRVVEGYPQEPRKDRMPDAFAWNGIASSYLRAGFAEAARRSPTRPIMRRALRRAAQQTR